MSMAKLPPPAPGQMPPPPRHLAGPLQPREEEGTADHSSGGKEGRLRCPPPMHQAASASLEHSLAGPEQPERQRGALQVPGGLAGAGPGCCLG